MDQIYEKHILQPISYTKSVSNTAFQIIFVTNITFICLYMMNQSHLCLGICFVWKSSLSLCLRKFKTKSSYHKCLLLILFCFQELHLLCKSNILIYTFNLHICSKFYYLLILRAYSSLFCIYQQTLILLNVLLLYKCVAYSFYVQRKVLLQ